MSGTLNPQRPLDYVAWLAEVVVILAIIVNIVVTFSNTLLRYTTNQDLPWNQDVSTIVLSIITSSGAPSYFRVQNNSALNPELPQQERDLLPHWVLTGYFGFSPDTMSGFCHIASAGRKTVTDHLDMPACSPFLTPLTKHGARGYRACGFPALLGRASSLILLNRTRGVT